MIGIRLQTRGCDCSFNLAVALEISVGNQGRCRSAANIVAIADPEQSWLHAVDLRSMAAMRLEDTEKSGLSGWERPLHLVSSRKPSRQ